MTPRSSNLILAGTSSQLMTTYSTGKYEINHPELLVVLSIHSNAYIRYLENFKVSEVADFLGAKMKEKHTIIEKWPYRLKLRPGQPGAQDEFDRYMSAGLSGKERYLEWQRVHPSMRWRRSSWFNYRCHKSSQASSRYTEKRSRSPSNIYSGGQRKCTWGIT